MILLQGVGRVGWIHRGVHEGRGKNCAPVGGKRSWMAGKTEGGEKTGGGAALWGREWARWAHGSFLGCHGGRQLWRQHRRRDRRRCRSARQLRQLCHAVAQGCRGVAVVHPPVLERQLLEAGGCSRGGGVASGEAVVGQVKALQAGQVGTLWQRLQVGGWVGGWTLVGA